ncbi:MAG: transcription antitermination factor NusB [Proteobacteria bacterium]|nr:transcription antitermination factor NusB [Pseudomonadota bacterium]
MNSAPKRPAGKEPGTDKNRSAARLAAVQALYEMDMVGAPVDAVLAEFLNKRWRLDADDANKDGERDGQGNAGPAAAARPMIEPDAGWLDDLVRGVSGRLEELDGLIGPALSGELSLERLEALIRAILRAGTYELDTKPEIPAEVIITEYLDVVHAFFDQKEARLVNGILDHLARKLRAGEL